VKQLIQLQEGGDILKRRNVEGAPLYFRDIYFNGAVRHSGGRDDLRTGEHTWVEGPLYDWLTGRNPWNWEMEKGYNGGRKN